MKLAWTVTWVLLLMLVGRIAVDAWAAGQAPFSGLLIASVVWFCLEGADVWSG